MRKQSFLAIAVVIAGCSSGVADPRGTSETQNDAVASLERESGATWSLAIDGRFEHLGSSRSGNAVLVPGASAAQATLRFLGRHKDVFAMRAPDAELTLEKEEIDELGMAHARFQQVAHGVPVVGAELAAHFDAAGRVSAIDTTYVSGLESVDLEPKLGAAAVAASVTSSVLAGAKGAVAAEDLETTPPRLVVYALGAGAARLAYEVTVRAIAGDEPAIWVTTIDAKTGDVLDRYDNLQTVTGNGVGVLGDAKPVEVAQSGGAYVMTDAAGGVPIRTYTARNQQTVPGTQVTSANVNAWDTGVPGAGAAVDAHVYAGLVFKYYKEKHARNAIDGNGGAMISTAHFGQSYDNAFWDGRGMSYGDGGTAFRPLSAGLDVVAHEFTHGITERTSQLRYQNQSGALNEAVSDIFGAFIEHQAKPDATRNWIMGEAIAKGGAIRNLATPSQGGQPAHMQQYRQTQQDNGGVHINSGIVNNAAYLMTVGGKNPFSNVEVKYGIGWEKSEKLWYRANTRYFVSTTNFGGAAQGVLAAAKDLAFTPNEQNIVDCAFKATGIIPGTCATIVSPQSTATPGSTDDPSTPGTEPGGAAGDDSATEEEAPAAPAKRKRLIVTEESACSVSSPGGSATNDTIALLLAAVSALALGRRRGRKR